jgi:hypothetical protein
LGVLLAIYSATGWSVSQSVILEVAGMPRKILCEDSVRKFRLSVSLGMDGGHYHSACSLCYPTQSTL